MLIKIISLIIILGIISINKIIARVIIRLLSKIVVLDDNCKLALVKPIGYILVLILVNMYIYLVSYWIRIDLYSNIYIVRIMKSIIISLFIRVLYILYTNNSIIFNAIEKIFDHEINLSIKCLLYKIIRIIIVTIGFGMILQVWGYDTNSLVTSLGVISVIVSVAAKESLSSIFSGLVLVLDKPFELGDYIQTSNYEGIVEDITFRNTKIRTFERTLVNIPNSKLISETIENLSKRNLRRVNFSLEIEYELSIERLHTAVEEIRSYLLKNKKS